ncbi:MAG: hypothetical protein K2N48_10495 [Muribaculaceae bacterium]|nr:hypothetical protein [Muribaculaceae bacterium]
MNTVGIYGCKEIEKQLDELVRIQTKVLPNLVVLEGPDGVGKTTIAKKLVDRLNSLGHFAQYRKEPGGNDIGIALREALLNRKELLPADQSVLAFATSAAITMQEIEKNPRVIYILDRYMESTLVYQFLIPYLSGSELDEAHERVRKAIAFFKSSGYLPSAIATFSIRRDTNSAFESACKDKNVYEEQGFPFYLKVVDGYRFVDYAQTHKPFNGTFYRIINSYEGDLDRIVDELDHTIPLMVRMFNPKGE